MGNITEIQEWFIIRKSINIIQHSNWINEGNTCDHNKCREKTEENSTPTHGGKKRKEK